MPSTIADTAVGEGFEDGSTTIDNDPAVPVEGFNREAAVEAVARVAQQIMIKENRLGPDGNPASIDELKEVYNQQATDAELEEMVNTIKESIKENGCLTMDESGKIVKAC